MNIQQKFFDYFKNILSDRDIIKFYFSLCEDITEIESKEKYLINLYNAFLFAKNREDEQIYSIEEFNEYIKKCNISYKELADIVSQGNYYCNDKFFVFDSDGFRTIGNFNMLLDNYVFCDFVANIVKKNIFDEV